MKTGYALTPTYTAPRSPPSVELEQFARPAADHRVGGRLDEVLDLFQQRLGCRPAAGDKRDAELRALMNVLQPHLGRGDLEAVPELVAQRLHHHPLLFQRLRVFDVKLEEGDGDNHLVGARSSAPTVPECRARSRAPLR